MNDIPDNMVLFMLPVNEVRAVVEAAEHTKVKGGIAPIVIRKMRGAIKVCEYKPGRREARA
jgi:hypothetical protein